MGECRVCGRSFDPLGFQVVVPKLGRGFDRIECAQSARALDALGTRAPVAPLPAVVEPIGLAAAAPAAATFRPSALPAAALALLAAATVAAASLWVRVLGTDTAGFPFTRADVPRAAAGETLVASLPQGTERSSAREEKPVAPRPDTLRPVAVVKPSGGDTGSGARPTTEDPTRPARRPSSDDDGGGRPHTGSRPGEGGKTKEKDNHGKGLGHIKHGDTKGTHEPGHGKDPGADSSRSSSDGHGNGHGKGKRNH